MGKPWKHFKSNKFVYGTCHTDHKKPHAYKGCHPDLFYLAHTKEKPEDIEWDDSEVQISAFVCQAFKRLGLPIPKQANIHYGTDGILLFLDSHGIVIRIHNNKDGDPRLFLHPHILQPVGWITDNYFRMTIALYKAAHLFSPLGEHKKRASRSVRKSLGTSSFLNLDLNDYSKRPKATGGLNNIGYLKLRKAERFPVCIDISHRIREMKRETADAFNKKRKHHPAFTALKVSFKHHAHSSFSPQTCAEAFDYHQPLRHAFFMAWPDADKNEGEPNPERMKKFWQMAQNYVERGYKICQKDQTTGQRIIVTERRSPIPWK